MRPLLIAALFFSLTSCGISVSSMPVNGKSIKETVAVCSEKAKQVCKKEVKQRTIKANGQVRTSATMTKAALSREMLLMLW